MLGSEHGRPSAGFICATSVLSSALIVSSILCDIHVEYDHQEEALNVSLVGKPFSEAKCRYNVSLWSLSSTGAHSQLGRRARMRNSVLAEPTGPVTTVGFDRVSPHYTYFIKVEQPKPAKHGTNCTSPTMSVLPQPFYHYIGRFRPRRRRSADCFKWNATVNLIPDVDEQSIIVLFRVLPPYVQCFDGYRLYLYRDVPWVCSGDVGARVASKKIDIHNGTVTFEHLSPGNYCLRIFRPRRPTVFYRVFYNALAVLFSKLDQALTDYKHILVVRFPYTPDSARLKYLVPGRRFVLPGHLVDLYKALHDVACDSVSSARELETELLQTWTESEASYAGLWDAVDEMAAFVALHPLYLSDVLTEVAV